MGLDPGDLSNAGVERLLAERYSVPYVARRDGSAVLALLILGHDTLRAACRCEVHDLADPEYLPQAAAVLLDTIEVAEHLLRHIDLAGRR